MMLRLAGERTDGTILWMADERAIGVAHRPARSPRPPRPRAGRRRGSSPASRCACAATTRSTSRSPAPTASCPRPRCRRTTSSCSTTATPARSATSSPPAARRRSRSGCARSPTPASPTCPSGSCPIGDGRDELVASSKRTRDYLASLAGLAVSGAWRPSSKRYSRPDERRSHLRKRTTMSHATLDIPVFDADNHLYETRDALTKFLPDRYKGADRLRRRPRPHEDRRPRPDQRLHPQPDVRRRGPARRAGGLLPQGQPRGQEPPGDLRRADAGHPGVPRAGAARRADGRAGHRPGAHVPDAGQPRRGAHAGRPRDDPRRHPRAQRVDPRDVAVRLRGPHLRHAGHHAADRRQGDRGARVGGRARRQGRARSARRRCPGFRGPRSFGLPEFDPFWEKVVEHDVLVAMHSSDSGYERYANDWMGSDSEMLPFQPQAFRMLSAWRPIEDAVVGARLPRRAVPLPAAQGRGDRERQQLGRAAARRTWPTSTRRCRRTSPRTRSTVIKRNIYISPFWEEDLGALAELIGVDHVLFGSDFPHPEGLADPASYVDELDGPARRDRPQDHGRQPRPADERRGRGPALSAAAAAAGRASRR